MSSGHHNAALPLDFSALLSHDDQPSSAVTLLPINDGYDSSDEYTTQKANTTTGSSSTTPPSANAPSLNGEYNNRAAVVAQTPTFGRHSSEAAPTAGTAPSDLEPYMPRLPTRRQQPTQNQQQVANLAVLDDTEKVEQLPYVCNHTLVKAHLSTVELRQYHRPKLPVAVVKNELKWQFQIAKKADSSLNSVMAFPSLVHQGAVSQGKFGNATDLSPIDGMLTKESYGRSVGVPGKLNDLRKVEMKDMKSILLSHGLSSEEIDGPTRWARVDRIQDMSTKAASDGIGDGRFARDKKMKLVDQEEIYQKRVQAIWARQGAMLSVDAPIIGPADNEEDSDRNQTAIAQVRGEFEGIDTANMDSEARDFVVFMGQRKEEGAAKDLLDS